MGMMDYSDLLLRLIPENAFSSQICEMVKNLDRFCEVKGRSALAIRLSGPIEDQKMGFVFGYDEKFCDVLFKKSELGPIHFSITLNPKSGLILLVNRNESGTLVDGTNLNSLNQSIVLQHRSLIKFGIYSFRADIPNRGDQQYQFFNIQRLYLGNLFTRLPAAVYCTYTTPRQTMKNLGPYYVVRQYHKDHLVVCSKEDGNLYTAKRSCNSAAWATLKNEIKLIRKFSHVRLNFC